MTLPSLPPLLSIRSGYMAEIFFRIFQMWWIGEGQTLPFDELEKIFKKMTTYCEKKANSKDQTHIESQFISYEADVKAK